MATRRVSSFDRDELGISSSHHRSLTRKCSREIDAATDDDPASTSVSLDGINSSSHHSRTRAFPGRPRRRKTDASNKGSGSTRRGGARKKSFWYRFYKRWIQGFLCSVSSLFLAVMLWYSLGVISIGTSKILLMQGADAVAGVPPLFLTLQQLIIGCSLLRFMLHIRFLGSSGLQPWPDPSAVSTDATSNRHRYNFSGKQQNGARGGRAKGVSGFQAAVKDALPSTLQPNLLMAGVYFTFGFLMTNYGFSTSSAAFVETIKAAEPLTSASVAVLWGIEVLSQAETASLGVIVAGVLLSTLGNANTAGEAPASTVAENVQACVIVMSANLCFSFRGLYQKLFRASTEGNAQVVDDINLQYRMQQIGAAILVVPVLLLETPTILRLLWALSTSQKGWTTIGAVWQYLSLALVNGCAFAGYNLASTFILSRISVVHHAALNCLRRIFAIIVTSIIFAIPMTLMGAFGIAVSVGGFMSFTHYKIQRQRQPTPLSSLLPVSAAPSNGRGYP